jgi:hypothetical protein
MASVRYPIWEKNFQRPIQSAGYFEDLESDFALLPSVLAVATLASEEPNGGPAGLAGLPVPEPAAVPMSTTGWAFMSWPQISRPPINALSLLPMIAPAGHS